MHQIYPPGSASASRHRKTFVPSDKQLEVAKRRILSTIEKHNGVLDAMNDKDALAFLERKVHNRGSELGDRRKGHFRKVLMAAWDELKRLAKIAFDSERYQFILTYRFEKPREKRQKYPAGRLAYGAR